MSLLLKSSSRSTKDLAASDFDFVTARFVIVDEMIRGTMHPGGFDQGRGRVMPEKRKRGRVHVDIDVGMGDCA